jgi:hypothetical protein
MQSVAAILLRDTGEPFSSILFRPRQPLVTKRDGKREGSDGGM